MPRWFAPHWTPEQTNLAWMDDVPLFYQPIVRGLLTPEDDERWGYDDIQEMGFVL